MKSHSHRYDILGLRAYCLNTASDAGLTNNLYFARNIVKRYFVLRNLYSVLVGCNIGDPKGHILDFGPGFGILLPALSRMYEKVTALDIDPSQLYASQKILDSARISNVSLILGRLQDEFEAFEDHCFNAIVADNVLEHIARPQFLIPHFIRLLKNNGILIVSLPSQRHIYRFFESATDGHLLRTRQAVSNLLSSIESKMKEVAILDSYPFFITRVYMITGRENDSN